MRIAKACRETTGARFIHVSTALASKQAASKLSRSRAEGEAALRSEHPECVIVRPSTMFGHEDRFLRALGCKPGLLLPSSSNLYACSIFQFAFGLSTGKSWPGVKESVVCWRFR